MRQSLALLFQGAGPFVEALFSGQLRQWLLRFRLSGVNLHLYKSILLGNFEAGLQCLILLAILGSPLHLALLLQEVDHAAFGACQ